MEDELRIMIRTLNIFHKNKNIIKRKFEYFLFDLDSKKNKFVQVNIYQPNFQQINILVFEFKNLTSYILINLLSFNTYFI